MRILLILLQLLILTGLSFSQVNQKMLAKIFVDSPDEIARLDDLRLDFASSRIEEYAWVVVSWAEVDEIESRGFKVEIVQYAADVAEVDPEYHDNSEILDLIDSLATAHPDITVLSTIGFSQVEGRPIMMMKISDNPGLDEDEPELLYDGLHHAREPVGMESCLVLMRHLLENYGIDSVVTDWVNSTEIWIIPNVNPDGWGYVVDGQLVDPWWRKNKRDNDNSGTFNPDFDGVDLNRNYDFNWVVGGSGDPTSWVYRGPFPFSESEVRPKRDLALNRRFIFSLSYHSFGEVILYSWSDFPDPPDQDLIQEVADSVASRIPRFAGPGSYASQPSNCQNGFSRCWMYVVAGTIEYTVETADQFVPSGVDGLQIAQDNLSGALYLLDRVRGPGLTGHVTDSLTADPLPATIRILEHDDPVLSPRSCDSTYGRYYRPLQPDNYTMEVSMDGYITKTFNSVEVTPGAWTKLDVQLAPIGVSVSSSDYKTPERVFLGLNHPNPFNPSTVIEYHLTSSSNVTLSIYDLLGREVRTLVNETKNAGVHKVTWDAKNNDGQAVSSGVYVYRLQAGAFVRSNKMLLLK